MGEIIRRPDLEAQVVSVPNYIGDRIFPFWGRPQVAGTMYYQKYYADFDAQTGRDTAALGDITDTIMESKSVNFSCSELRARVKMGYTEIAGYFDKEHADLALGRRGKRAWFNKLEKNIANALLNPADAPVDGTADIVSVIDAQAAILRDLGIGELALVCSNHNKVLLKSNATIVERMKATGVPTGVLSDVRNVQDIQLAACLGVDEVITGKDAIWYSGLTGADKDNIALIVRPTPEVDPSEEVQLGRTIYFMWSDSEADKFIMESWHDNYKDAEVVDAKGLVEIKTLNKELRTVIRAFNNNSDSSDSGSGSESLSL